MSDSSVKAVVNDHRTDGQKKADINFRDALEDLIAAYEVTPLGYSITSFIVLGYANGLKKEDQGLVNSEIDFMLLPDGGKNSSSREVIGTLDIALLNARDDYRTEIRKES